MTYRRGRLEVVYDILRSARKPIKPTRLMSDARLRHGSIKMYEPYLIERGLLKKIPFAEYDYKNRRRRQSRKTTHVYVTTEKGRKFLRLFERGKEHVDLFNRLYSMLGWDGQTILRRNKEEK